VTAYCNNAELCLYFKQLLPELTEAIMDIKVLDDDNYIVD